MRPGIRDIDDASASLGDAMHGLRRAGPAMLICMVIAAGLAEAIVRAQVPLFAATATLLVRAPSDPRAQPGRAQLTANPAFENSEMENQLAVLHSERLIRDVHAAETPNARVPAMSVEDFAAGLTVRRLGSSNVLEVTYTSLDPDEAARSANAVVAGYLKERVDGALADASAGRLTARINNIEAQSKVAADALRQGRSPMGVLGDADALVLDSATRPTSPISPQRPVSLLFAAIMGLVLPAGIAMMRGIVNPPIRTERDTLRLLGLPCLGQVPTPSRSASIDGRRTAAELLARRLRGDPLRPRIGVVAVGPSRLLDDVEALVAAFTAPDLHVVAIRTPLPTALSPGSDDRIVFAVHAGTTTSSSARRVINMWQQAGWPVAGVILLSAPPHGRRRLWPAPRPSIRAS